MELVEKSVDVLVVGSGGAGLRAAIEAAHKGVKTLLVSKAPVGLANCTIVSGGAFTVAIEGMTPGVHFNMTMDTGKSLNNASLVKVLTEESPGRIYELEEMGLDLVKGKGRAIVKTSPGSSMIRGKKITRVMEIQAKKAGVSMDERVVLVDLILRDNRVLGAIGYNYASDQLVIYQAKAVVMATGGAGAIYARHDNPGHITGDGYAVFYRAGVKLQDMEMVQFYPAGLADPQHADFLVPPTLMDEGKIFNTRQEDIKEKYKLPRKQIAIVARDTLSRAVFQEILLGNGIEGALFLDLTEMPEEKWLADPLAATAKRTFIEKLGAARQPLRICPLCHHFMGGAVIDENCQAGVAGLYAAGEVAGGLHGANRMGGNALSETLVFGARAGSNAALYAQDVDVKPMEKKLFNEEINILQRMRHGSEKGKIAPESIKKELQKTMWDKAGLVRSKKGLQEALSLIKRLEKDHLSSLAADSPRQFLEVLETINMVQVSQMVVTSALTRQESRGAHFRTDYIEQNDREWRRNILLQKRGEEIAVELGNMLA
ncbi:MAG: FAD-binding protein [Candidatus Tectomicrobia bacterium]|uniref:FAD-binding protein n=1 Tax=Tectimicrobiota bacterium TaxID=2528274 RepID=A0A933GMF6_UNCTE|nr:FAD-binding protein [Candidatus Tectomicrobia bacterium]